MGATATGKTKLSIELAKKTNSIIVSLDSLSIYKEIDIASAKPTLKERCGVVHFGIDEIFINQSFDVKKFFELYFKSKKFALENNKNLIIVGGTSFYLKSMIYGLSPRTKISNQTKIEVQEALKDRDLAYKKICEIDEAYSKKISKNDTYRMEKWFEIYLQTGKSLTKHFEENRQKPIIEDIKIYQIAMDREVLRERIFLRTQKMVKDGLIDEVRFLREKYGESPNAMNSIGIKESIDYLDGKISKDRLIELITNHTRQLAKRQRTFNKTQFKNVEVLKAEEILKNQK